MPRRKYNQKNLSKIIEKKIPLEELPYKTMRVTVHALRWVFLLIFLFILVGIFALLLNGGQENFKMIITYGITGFFTFFMGYFGWILAQGTIEMITGKEQKGQSDLFYYQKRRKHKF